MSDELPYLRLPRIEAKPKTVEISENYRRAVALTAAAESDLLFLIRTIADGAPIPDRFYRKDIDLTPDRLLADRGVMHLHLAGQNSDQLLYLVQFDDAVLLLEANTHKHFGDAPPGKLLASLHHTPLTRAYGRARAQRAARVEAFGKLRDARATRGRHPSPKPRGGT